MSPIADMVTRIRNAAAARHSQVGVRFSRIKKQILDLLKKERYIHDYKVIQQDGHDLLVVDLAYTQDGKRSAIHGMRLISKPSRRFYSGFRSMKRFLNGYGIVVVSTSQGVMTGEQMREKKVGGELIFSIW